MIAAVLSRKGRNGRAEMCLSEILAFRVAACKIIRLTARLAHAAGGVHVDGSSWVEAGRV